MHRRKRLWPRKQVPASARAAISAAVRAAGLAFDPL
jgi:hypothetical protein